MTVEGYWTLGILAAAVVAFASGRWRPDAIAVLALLALVLSGILDTRAAFAGFGSPVLVAVAAVYVISAGLDRTGIAASIGRRILRFAGGSETALTLLFGGAGGVLSGFMNSMGAMAVLLPAAVAAAREGGISPSRLLLPLALGTRLGGSLTLIAAPTNLIATATLEAQNLRQFGFFEVSPLGVSFLVAGLAFMVLVGRRWLPSATPAESATRLALMNIYRLGERLYEIRIGPDSPLVGKTLEQSALRAAGGATVLSITRPRTRVVAPPPTERLASGDHLLIKARLDELLESGLFDAADIRERTHVDLRALESADVRVVEVILAPRSSLFGKTLRELDFREKYGATVLAIWRADRPMRTHLGDQPVQLGDALLVQAHDDSIRLLARDPDFLVLTPEQAAPLRRDRAVWALAALALMVLLSISGLNIAVAALAAAAVVVASGCLTAQELYTFVDWRVLVFIGAMLPMSTALTVTGAAGQMVSGILEIVGTAPLATLAALLGIGLLLNQMMPSVAATVLLAPIAVRIATTTGTSSHALMMAVIAAAATTFTPISNPVNLLVMGPGGYRLRDYVRLGLPLALLLWIVALLVIPLLSPLR